jgi:NitT/TauT family transport system permease protein
VAAETSIHAATQNPVAAATRPKWHGPFGPMWFASVVLLIALIAAWEFGVRLFNVPKFVLPPLSDVAIAMYRGLAASPFSRDGFWLHTWVTLWEILLGFGLGSAIGLVLAIVISEFELVEILLRPYIAALQSLPKVAVAPIIVMWMGFGIGSKVAIVCLITFFPVLVTSIAGFKAIDPDRIDLLRSLSATRWQIFAKAKFPSALPYVFAGLDMAAAFSVVGAVVGEFVGAQAGLGVMILQMDAQLDTGGSFAIFAILSALGIALTAMLRAVRRRMLSWMPVDETRQTVSV